MPDDKRRDGDDLAANLKKLEEAAERPDDAADIAADDQGATAMAQKIAKLREADDA